MKRIDRKYAVIYVDTDGSCLNPNLDNYSTDEIISDYYKNSGFLQWNFYLLIPKELVDESSISEIENNDIYTRKIILERNEIEKFIDERFPPLRDKMGTIKLIKGNSWKESVMLAEKELNNNSVIYPSWYRNENMMHTLNEMDVLRAKLIRNPDLKTIMHSHISNEMFIAEKKFKFFQI